MDGAAKLLRVAHASEGSLPDDILAALGVRAVGIGEQRPVLLGDKETWGNGVYPDGLAEFPCALMRHVSSEIGDAGFGRRIAAHARHWAEGCHRREIDDAALALADNGLQENLCRYDGASEIKVQDGLELGRVKVEEVLVGTDGRSLHVSSGSVEQGIDAMGACKDAVTHVLHLSLTGDVACFKGGLPSVLADGIHDVIARLPVASQQYHFGSLCCQIGGYLAAQHARAARDDHHIIFDIKKVVHIFLLF